MCNDENFSEIILKVVRCKSVRYKNGRDYVQEEVIPMAMKEIIGNINSGANYCGEKFYVLAKLMERANLAEIKI